MKNSVVVCSYEDKCQMKKLKCTAGLTVDRVVNFAMIFQFQCWSSTETVSCLSSFAIVEITSLVSIWYPMSLLVYNGCIYNYLAVYSKTLCSTYMFNGKSLCPSTQSIVQYDCRYFKQILIKLVVKWQCQCYLSCPESFVFCEMPAKTELRTGAVPVSLMALLR